MNINFHYFAVKAISRKAGFAEDEAQIIASYSQFVDDFSIYNPMFIENVPEFAMHLAKKIDKGYLFNPVTTGFNSWLEMARLTNPENQKMIVMPFHFVPKAPLNTLPSRSDWRVVSVKAGDSSVLWDLLSDAKTKFLSASGVDKNLALMRIGMLLHTFADSYAHENFSGFCGWENHSYIEKVTNNITGEDITNTYNILCHWLPSIAHTNVDTTPDDSAVTFNIRQKEKDDKNYNLNYNRNNTDYFLKAAREILNFLRDCLGESKVTDNAWQSISESFSKGFYTIDIDEKILSTHWKSIFPDIEFSYDKNTLFGNMLKLDTDGVSMAEAMNDLTRTSEFAFTAKNDLFFNYNVIADQIRDKIVNDIVGSTKSLSEFNSLSVLKSARQQPLDFEIYNAENCVENSNKEVKMMIKNTLEAKEFAAQLREKADKIEKLDEKEIAQIQEKFQAQNESCTLFYCRFIQCIVTDHL